MRSTALHVCLLALLSLVLGCGGPSEAPAGADGPALPAAEASWIAGSREAPTAGRLVVGLLLERRNAQRLADLLPPAKLKEWLARESEAPERVDVLIEEAWYGPAHRTWGPMAGKLAAVRKELHEKHGIEVVFREVLADELAGIPLVLVGTRRLHAEERAQLKAWRETGGRLLQLGREVMPQSPLSDADATLRSLRAVLADSPLLHVLPGDPLAASAEREGDEVVLTLAGEGVRVALEDATGTTLVEATTGSDGRVRLRAPDPELDPFQHHVVARWQGDGLSLARAWSLVDLVGTVETRVEAGDAVHAGGALAVRIHAHVNGEPVAGRSGRVELVREETVIAATPYTTDDEGFAHPVLALATGATPGAATLRCDGLEKGITITSGLRLSVVTDRPLYKQTDTVHVRLMAHRAGDGRPVAGQQVELSIGEAKRTVTTSEHGIASHAFALSDARVGDSKVTASADGAETRCAFRVKAFERPTFTLSAEPASLELRRGESAPVTLIARYVNGTPFVGGTPEISPSRVELVSAAEGFDAQGRLEVVVKSMGRSRAALYVDVKDAEGRRMELTVPVAVRAQGARVQLRALSDVAVGVPARFEIACSEPGVVRIGGNFRGPEQVEIGEDGRVEVELTPTQGPGLLRLIPEGGSAREWQPTALVATEKQPLVMALDRRGACVGESLRIHLRSGSQGGAGLVHLEVWKEGTPIRTLSERLVKGMQILDLPLEPSMTGLLQVQARLAGAEHPTRRATVLVTRGRALQVETKAAKERHAPGGLAEVDVTVRTATGEPTAAVLGYWGVDEALLALAPATTGHERVFDVVLAGGGGKVLDWAEAVDRREAIEAEALAHQFGDYADLERLTRTFPVVLQRTPALVKGAQAARHQQVSQALTRIWEAYGPAWKDIPVTELMRADSLRETLQWLARKGRLDPALLLDPWGTPFCVYSDKRNVYVHWWSAGPDRLFGNEDDVMRTWDGSDLYWSMPERVRAFHEYVRVHHDPSRLEDEEAVEALEEMEEELFDALETDGDIVFEESFGMAEGGPGAAFEGPATNSAIGLGGGAGGAFRGRAGGRDLGTGGGGLRYQRPLYVRKDFDPTLCFVPEAIVGPDGKARLEIPLKDSITTWRLRLVASASDGAVGIGEGSLRVGQSVHAAPWMASHLTVGDVVEVPVAIRNEEPREITARVVLAASEHLGGLTAPEVDVTVPARGTGRALFKLEARAPGTARVRITVDTGEAQDRQERIVTVHRHARPVVAVLNGSVAADAAFPVVLAAAGPGEVRMELYPSPLAEVLSGFEGLIRAPHG